MPIRAKNTPNFPVGQQVIEAGPGYQRKGQIDQRNQQAQVMSTGKQLPVVFEVMQKNRQGLFFRYSSVVMGRISFNKMYLYTV